MQQLVLHIVRPYTDQDAYLAAEAWTIESKGMLLLDQEPLEPETTVLFEVSLLNGVKLIRAEGRVLPAMGTAPGVRVRFRRFGSQTQAFIERALLVRGEQLARESSQSSVPPRSESLLLSELPKASAGEPRLPSAPPASAELGPSVPPASAEIDRGTAHLAPEVTPSRREASALQRRPSAPISAPPNRDELLGRLRERAQRLGTAVTSSRKDAG